jgi:ubiquinone/menaquinone biosynthesis C-methylase UbiE
MAPEFGGDVAICYSKYRRGYDESVIDWLADALALDRDSIVVDLGCGTGQLAIPISARVRAVVGIDPEPEMLVRAAAEADRQGRTNVSWTLGSDRDLAALGALLGDRSIAALVIGNAIHLMDHEGMFKAIYSLIRPGGGVALLANSTPLWQQDSPCSRAVRAALERWFDTKLTSMCGTDHPSRRMYAAALRAAGYSDVTETVIREYAEEMDLQWVIGHLYSAIPEDQLPGPDQRASFEQRIRAALGPTTTFTEYVVISALTGRVPSRPTKLLE